MLLSSKIWKQVQIKGNRVYQINTLVHCVGDEEKDSVEAGETSNRDEGYREMVEQAREEAARLREQILQESREEAKRIRETAWQEGYDQGYREGLRKGQLEAEKLRQEAEKILEEARRRREEIITSAEPEVVRLALDMAEKILHRRLEEDPDTVVDQVVRALQEVPYGKPVVVRVHPDDEMICRHAEDRLHRYLRGAAELEIVADSEVPRGGCRVETSEGRIEVLPEEEMARLRGQLLAMTGGSWSTV